MSAIFDMDTRIHDDEVLTRCARHLRARDVRLPTLAELANPALIPENTRAALTDISPDAPHPMNLFRVHWYNDRDRWQLSDVPAYVVLPEALTGVASPILVLLGNTFPMIRAHKVLAAYGCLVPRLVTGRFDPTTQRAVWPSTGNYCRGGVAISRALGCRGVAVLPEGMSRERFDWLDAWVSDPSDIVRTPGSESNVKEIYDACAAMAEDDNNVIFNQFREFSNHLVHYQCTGRALEHVFTDYVGKRAAPGSDAAAQSGLRLAGFVSATGSAGTIGAGDYLKERLGTRIVAAEALECPTMLYNGYGEHNIQGIGDKHIPLIHNVMNTDVVAAISDHCTDSLHLLFHTETGKDHLTRVRGLDEALVTALDDFGLSSICNVLAAIKTAKILSLGANDVLVTVATDGAEMYGSELELASNKHFAGRFDADAAARCYDSHLADVSVEHAQVLRPEDRERIFNLGYFTWVEQRGVTLSDFEARRSQSFWSELHAMVPAWDQCIDAMNQRVRADDSI